MENKTEAVNGMDMWRLLGIAPTEDLAEIERAYGQSLRIFHRGEDPEAFRELTEAYEAAKRHALASQDKAFPINWQGESDRHQSADQIATDHTLVYKPMTSMSVLSDEIHGQSVEKSEPPFQSDQEGKIISGNPHEQHRAWLNQMQALYSDLPSRIHPENWEKLMQNEAVLNMNTRPSYEAALLDFLESHRMLPREVWELLIGVFGWTADKKSVLADKHESFLYYIRRQIRKTRPLSYAFLKKAEGVDYETYLKLREQAYECLERGDLKQAEDHAGLARKIYADDPELSWIEAQLHITQKNREGALRCLNAYLEHRPDDIKALFQRAELLSNRFQYDKAIEDYQHILALDPTSRAAMTFLAECHLAGRHPEKAKKILEKMLMEHPRDKAVYSMMVRANHTLMEQYRAEQKKHPGDPGMKRRIKLLKKEMEERFQASQPKKGFFGRHAPLLAALGGILVAVILILTSLPGRAAPQTYSESKAADDPAWDSLIQKQGNVSLTVENVINLGLVCSLEYKDNKECKPVFYDLEKIKSNGWLLKDNWGMVFIGESGDKEVILILNGVNTSKNGMFKPYSESFIENGATDGLRITGKLYKVPDDETMISVRKALSNPKLKGKVGPIVTDMIMVEDKSIASKPVYPYKKGNDVDLARLLLGVGALFFSLMTRFIKLAKSER